MAEKKSVKKILRLFANVVLVLAGLFGFVFSAQAVAPKIYSSSTLIESSETAPQGGVSAFLKGSGGAPVGSALYSEIIIESPETNPFTLSMCAPVIIININQSLLSELKIESNESEPFEFQGAAIISVTANESSFSVIIIESPESASAQSLTMLIQPAVNTPPQQPNTPTPGHGATNISVYLNQLQWQSGDADPLDILWFDIYFNTDEDKVDSDPVTEGVILDSVRLFNDFTIGTPTPLDNPFLYTYNLAGWPGLNLEPNTFYYWRVSAFDGKDFVFSPVPVWKFKTVIDEPDIRTSEDGDFELDFGAVKIGATKTMYMVVCNFPVINDKLTTTNISVSAGDFILGDEIYPVDNNGVPLAPADIPDGTSPTKFSLNGIVNGKDDGQCLTSSVDQPSYNIMIKFSPGTIGSKTSVLTIQTDDPNYDNDPVGEGYYIINLKGDGEAPPATITPTTPSGGVKIRR